MNKRLIIIILVIFLMDYILSFFNKNPFLFYKKSVFCNYNSHTLPPFGIVIQDSQKGNEALLKHELIHWEQYRKTGSFLFYLNYAIQKIIYGYDYMPMEIEARCKSNEHKECITSYTSCVRKGIAKTVDNKHFRT